MKTFRNGILQTDENVFDRGGWQADTTYSFWPSSNLTINNSSDFGQTNKIIKGESISKRGFAVRKAKISNDRANWIKNGAFREAGCNTYWAAGGIRGGCNCADYTKREWYFLTSQWEDFRIRAIVAGGSELTLDYLVDQINKKNRESGDFFNGGRVGQ